MVIFFKGTENEIFALNTIAVSPDLSFRKLEWLLNNATLFDKPSISGSFIGPRKEMITPWSTNAVEIMQNMGIREISRAEIYRPASGQSFDPMLEQVYKGLDQNLFKIERTPGRVMTITDVEKYNREEGLALSPDEVEYLTSLSRKLGRGLTDSEIFGFSQVNSEHCRHKIFNGTFIIDGKQKERSLFDLIKHTTNINKNRVVSAYKDNCAFLKGPQILQFAPETSSKPGYFGLTPVTSAISLKAETHNFPTTVEPFNGAATGSGGEIRDRMAGGKGSIPLAGTAVYMTSYPRLDEGRTWEKRFSERKWLYHDPASILIKASNGASDFGNKFGQPLICGSLFTFEHTENDRTWGYDKVIMLAGGVGYADMKYTRKDMPSGGDKIVLLGGDNYRIGMGGGAVSSVATGEYGNAIELNAVQRSNPEMQKRVYNVIRALAESAKNPVISIHDHGAGGHLNCLSELVENTGGTIYMDMLPIGDPTLSAKEIIGNESQERMGLIVSSEDIALLKEICDRERTPCYVIGEVTGDHRFIFRQKDGVCPINLDLGDLFGNPPRTIINDTTVNSAFSTSPYSPEELHDCLVNVLQIESVACKDWLTNKVDRSVTGLVAKQQTCGKFQLPLNDVAVASLDYYSRKGVATALGHTPVAGLINPVAGSVLAISEALTNIVWAPIEEGLKGVSLSANWMWPSKNPGEDSRLYSAVKAASDFAAHLGINIPTGKDSLSMTQKYPDGKEVYAPGTVIVSAAGEVTDIRKIAEPVIRLAEDSIILYVDFSSGAFDLGGSAFLQTRNEIGTVAPGVEDAAYFAASFDAVQECIKQDLILAGHDISSGGIIVTLLEMCFPTTGTGMNIKIDIPYEQDPFRLLFSEKPGIVIQVRDDGNAENIFKKYHVDFYHLGRVTKSDELTIYITGRKYLLNIPELRRKWFRTSYLLDSRQVPPDLALSRFDNFDRNPLSFVFKEDFTGKMDKCGIIYRRTEPSGIKAAIIREKGVNGDREMANIMYLAGFDVKDVHMTDLITGRETLEDVNFIVFVGGFSNSDVLGSAKGWAGAFMYNEKAGTALEKFYARNDTLSLGVCNGCQLMAELGLITPEHAEKPKMLRNTSHKFESAFLSVDIPSNSSVMFGSLSDSRLGIWVAHGEGRFSLPYPKEKYNVALVYSHTEYPKNPNGSDNDVAGICSEDGRHLAIMPHIERCAFPWNWAYYPERRKHDEITPWIEAFINAREWISKRRH